MRAASASGARPQSALAGVTASPTPASTAASERKRRNCFMATPRAATAVSTKHGAYHAALSTASEARLALHDPPVTVSLLHSFTVPRGQVARVSEVLLAQDAQLLSGRPSDLRHLMRERVNQPFDSMLRAMG